MKKLNKYISDSGYCSRRRADEYIAQGRVTVNGADAGVGALVGDGDAVEVDGERVGGKPRRAVYIAFNKPVGVTSTTDAGDRTNIVDYIGHKERIFHVGRLDKDSEGLIVLTNDGDIVNKILRAGNENPKEYVVTVDRPLTGDFLSRMSGGVRILGTVTRPCRVRRKNETTFVIHLTQGLNRQIRRMCRELGYRVTRLVRVRVMNITLGGLKPGQWRYFTAEETAGMLALLKGAVGTEEASAERRTMKAGARSGGNGGKAAKPRGGSYADYRRKVRGAEPETGSRGSAGGRRPKSRKAGGR